MMYLTIPCLVPLICIARTTFSVDDTSPSISYSPFGDTLSTVNLTAGWNPYFDLSGFATSPGETGQGNSYHVTELNGASLSISWKGTGIQLLGYKNNSNYEITLDGAIQESVGSDAKESILATFQNLADTQHVVSLSAQIPPNQDLPNKSAIFFDRALIISSAETSSNSSFTQQSLNNSALSFTGQWSFVNNSTNAVHHSQAKGDLVRTTFTGASFLLRGTTSPQSGKYSVILDNAKTTLSGQSSFRQEDSILFFASGLDPKSRHDLQVVNEDGRELSLRADGFHVFASGSPNSFPAPSPVSGATSTSHPKGTIAALALAGILVFIILSGSLFFFFVVRPRRRRARLARLERRRVKENEAGGVIDIAPGMRDLEGGSAEASAGHRQSGRSGFARWKREVEGSLGSLGIGIAFRRSDSTHGRRSGPDDGESEPLSAKSSIFTSSSRFSSKRGRGKGKKKAKPKHVSESSWSPSFALELPIRPPSSADSYKDKEAGPSHFSPDGQFSITSDLTSLSYASNPRARANIPAIAIPPSYSISNSSGPSPPQFPRSVSHSSPSSKGHSRKGSNGLLLKNGEVNPGSPDEEVNRNYEPFMSSLSPPSGTGHSYPFLAAHEDRGSAKYSSDDATSYIGSATARLAIRGLSPRTTEFAEGQHQRSRAERARMESEPSPPVPSQPESADRVLIGQPIDARPVEQRSESKAPRVPDTSFLEVRSPANQLVLKPPELHSGAETTGALESSFIDVVTPGPSKVEFGECATQKPRHTESERTSDGNTDTTEERSTTKAKKPSKKRSGSRLNPSNPASSQGHSHAQIGSSSFLDFSSSSENSRAQSIATSEFSVPDWPGHQRQPTSRWSKTTEASQNVPSGASLVIDSPGQQQLTSRWSNTPTQMTEVSQRSSSAASVAVGSPVSPPNSIFTGGVFPYPISLPPSPHHPEGHINSPTQARLSLSQDAPPPTSDVPSSSRLHPSEAFGSPDSIPMSISELKFRHSGSTGESHSSGELPPHPPLPPLPNTPTYPNPSYAGEHTQEGAANQSGTYLPSGRTSTSTTPTKPS